MASSIAGQFLSGLRVLDLSQYLPGPIATLHLADFGAEVIKVEPPHGDPMALLGPVDANGQPVYYHAVNAGKKVIRLNLKSAIDHAHFMTLVRTADVIVEGFRPGVLARLGLDYDALKAAKADIILCSISGYGATTHAAQVPGHDANYMAGSGVMPRNGGGRPMFYDPPIADMVGALYAATAILAALQGRARNGDGCVIDIGLSDTVMPLQILQVADYGATGRIEASGESYLNGAAAYYNVYRCSDGRHVVVGAVERKFWEIFCSVAGRPDWLGRQHEPFPQNSLTTELIAYFARMSSQEVVDLFGPAHCCVSLVNTLDEAIKSERVVDRQLVRRADDGSLQALFPAVFNGATPNSRRSISTFDQVVPSEAGSASFRPETNKKRHM